MKYLCSLPLCAVAVFAQNQFPDPDFEPTDELFLGTKPDLGTIVGPAGVIATNIVAVNASTVNLDKAVIAFEGADQISELQAASDALRDQLAASATEVGAQTPIGTVDDDQENYFAVLALVPYVNSLSYHVNHTVVNLVLKKQLFVDTCVGPLVLQNIEVQQTSANDFISVVNSILPEDLRDTAQGLVDPIVTALSSAAGVFADQTALPESCSTTTTTTTETTTATDSVSGSATETSTTTETTLTTVVVPGYPTGSKPVEGSYPTGGAYPTSGTGKSCHRRRRSA